jgi:hypothetical protein
MMDDYQRGRQDALREAITLLYGYVDICGPVPDDLRKRQDEQAAINALRGVAGKIRLLLDIPATDSSNKEFVK